MTIVYQDERIVVAVKPNGVLSTDEPGGMPSLLRQALGEGTDGCVRVVHRLDRPVGGVMVFARSRVADRLLSGQVQRREFEKEYLAVIEGILPEKTGLLEDWLLRDRRTRKTIAVSQPGPETRPAALKFETLAEENGRSLVRIRLLTGRTHQIRAQFSSRGYPLCGDRKYGTKTDGDIALWSYRIAFSHPQTGERMEFSALPPDGAPWEDFSEQLHRL